MRVTDVGENVDRLASKQTSAFKGKKSAVAKPKQLRGELSRLFKVDLYSCVGEPEPTD